MSEFSVNPKTGFSSWQQSIWPVLSHLVKENHLPHALLFSGSPASGKEACADALIAVAFCESPRENAGCSVHCGICRQCILLQAGSHPDIFRITPEKPGQGISIAAIRDSMDFVYASPLVGRYRIILIHPADAMNPHAANALLKTLEEPPAGVIFILLGEQCPQLPATITSRCQKFRFRQDPAGENPLQQLQQAFCEDLSGAGVPVDPLAIAEKWSAREIQEKVSVKQLLDWLFCFLKDRLHDQLLSHAAQPLVLEKVEKQQLSLFSLFDYVDYVTGQRRHIQLSATLNRQLLLEDLLIRWEKLCA